MSVVSPSRNGRAATAPSEITSPFAAPAATLSEPAVRTLGVLGVSAIAVIHILIAPGAFGEVRYMFWLYIAIAVGAIPVSLALIGWSSPLAWVGAAAIAAGPLLGYVLTRTTGLPGADDDIGNWLETAGVASLFVEAGVLSLALMRLATLLRARA